MKVSYIIVAYKSSELLRTLLESIKSQATGDDELQFEYEVIVVDNSPDCSSADVVAAILPESHFIQNNTNRGYTAAINQGIKQSTGDYLFLLNPDIILESKCTMNLVRALGDNVGAAAPQLRHRDGSIQKSVRNFPRFATLLYELTGLARLAPNSPTFGHWRNNSFSHAEESAVAQPMASALMIRADVAAAIGTWDDQFFIFFSDVDYCKRIHDAGLLIKFIPTARAEHGIGGSTRGEGTWLIWESHRGFARYLNKHELRGAMVVLRPVARVMLWFGALVRVMWRKLRGRKF